MGQKNISIRIDEQGIPFPLTTVGMEPQKQARKDFGAAIRAAQEQSIINGTDRITLDEINDIIAECRQETSAVK